MAALSGKNAPLWEHEGEEYYSPGRETKSPGQTLKDNVPLMPKHIRKETGLSFSDLKNRDHLKDKLINKFKSPPTFKTAHNGKMEYYDHERLLSWQALFIISQSVFADRRVWTTGIYMMCISALTATALVILVPSARRFSTDGFSYFVTFLKVFIIFMIGIYLNKSFKRWWSTVMAFKSFLTSIKQLMYTIYAIDVSRDSFEMIERYCIASAYILNTEVHNAQHIENETTMETYYMHHLQQTFAFLQESELLQASEIDELREVKEETGGHCGILTTTMWAWIGEQVSEVKREADEAKVTIPPPLHLRLLILCQDCLGQVEELKTIISVQVPYSYAHLLAFLVHVYNTLLAFSCGISFGSAAAEVLVRRKQMSEHPTTSAMADMTRELYGAAQVMGVQFLIVLIEPVLYQAFLHIAHALCYPFGNSSYHLPVESFIAQLHLELVVMALGKQNHEDIMLDPDTLTGSLKLAKLAAGKIPTPKQSPHGTGADSSV